MTILNFLHVQCVLFLSYLLHWIIFAVHYYIDVSYQIPAALILFLGSLMHWCYSQFLLHWCFLSVPCCVDAISRFFDALMLPLSSLLHWCNFPVPCCIDAFSRMPCLGSVLLLIYFSVPCCSTIHAMVQTACSYLYLLYKATGIGLEM